VSCFFFDSPLDVLLRPHFAAPRDLPRVQHPQLLLNHRAGLRMDGVSRGFQRRLRLAHEIVERALARDPLRLMRLVEQSAAGDERLKALGESRRIGWRCSQHRCCTFGLRRRRIRRQSFEDGCETANRFAHRHRSVARTARRTRHCERQPRFERDHFEL